jgi:autotransporter-associated beta strand protein
MTHTCTLRISPLLLACLWLGHATHSTAEPITPAIDNTLLLNPGKGWVDYYGSFPYTNEVISTVYNRPCWAMIEPAEGKYNWSIFDGMISQWARDGKQVGIAVINTDGIWQYSTPKWVFDAGAVPLVMPAGHLPAGNRVIPKAWDDPVYLAKMKNFIAAFGKHYNGNPNVAFVDIRSYGECGECNGAFPGFIENTTQANLRDNYFMPYVKAFPKTRLIVPWTAAWFDGKNADEIYAGLAAKGVGIRRDGICSTWSKDASECLIAYGHAPAVLEYAASWADTVKDKFDSPETLLAYVTASKASYMQFHKEFYELHKEFCHMLGNKIGYHFILEQADIPQTIQAAVPFELTLQWRNDGVAPLYEPCSVALALLDSNNNVVEQQWLNQSKPQSWLPDTSTTEKFKVAFTKAPAGSKLALGLFLNPRDKHPTYRLGIKGRVNNGWYVLSGAADQVAATWANKQGGSWRNGPWTGNNTHGGVDVIADFSTLDLTRDTTLTLDAPIIAGNLIFGDTTPSHNWTLASGKDGSLMLRVSAGTPCITVNNQSLTISAPLVSHLGLAKNGPGTLVLAGSNELVGDIHIQQGVLEIAGSTCLYGKWQDSTVSVGKGGTLRVNGWGGYGGAGGGDLNQVPLDKPRSLVLDGGTLEFAGAGGATSAREFTIAAGGGTLRNSSKQAWVLAAAAKEGAAPLSNPSSLTLDGSGPNGRLDKALAGSGSLIKTGPGTWVLAGSNTYKGPTTVSQGTLKILGALAAESAVTVSPGATLGGTGAVNGPLTVNGTLAPGTDQPGTLTVANKLALTGTTTLRLSKSGATCLNDKVAGMTRVTYGGTLVVSKLGDAALAAGDTFTLFDSRASSGSFASITLPTLSAGLQWNTAELAAKGIIKIVPVPVSPPPNSPPPPSAKP